jgi:hypothetical protein
MDFLTKQQCMDMMESASLHSDEVMRLRRIPERKNAADFFHPDSSAKMTRAGAVIADWFPKYKWALFWFSGSPFGDGWGEFDGGVRARPQWGRLKAWRESHGAHGRVYDTPGHLLTSDERSALLPLAAMAIGIGWDCALVARPSRALVYFHHDEVLKIQSDHNVTMLAKKLEKLGFTRKEFH